MEKWSAELQGPPPEPRKRPEREPKKRYCVQCGAELSPLSNHCTVCGTDYGG